MGQTLESRCRTYICTFLVGGRCRGHPAEAHLSIPLTLRKISALLAIARLLSTLRRRVDRRVFSRADRTTGVALRPALYAGCRCENTSQPLRRLWQPTRPPQNLPPWAANRCNRDERAPDNGPARHAQVLSSRPGVAEWTLQCVWVNWNRADDAE